MPGGKIIDIRLPQTWRSSFAAYGAPLLEPDEHQQFGEYLQVLAFHAVPPGKVGVIRRIEATPTLKFVGDDETIYRLPVLPEQGDELQDQTLDRKLLWHWRWTLVHREIATESQDAGTLGSIVQLPIPQDILSIVGAYGTVHDYHGEAQAMHGAFPAACQHGAGTRFWVEGPRWIILVALVTGGKLDLLGVQQPLVFGHSLGSLEGIDVDTAEFLASPQRWLVP